mmetsp:Transcript_41863/g.130819  ORF Transcript_41863/g.130819 Transcript_41863/m.130819 type:complete len:255 (-) Transcript_41863:1097-1861(-)
MIASRSCSSLFTTSWPLMLWSAFKSILPGTSFHELGDEIRPLEPCNESSRFCRPDTEDLLREKARAPARLRAAMASAVAAAALAMLVAPAGPRFAISGRAWSAGLASRKSGVDLLSNALLISRLRLAGSGLFSGTLTPICRWMTGETLLLPQAVTSKASGKGSVILLSRRSSRRRRSAASASRRSRMNLSVVVAVVAVAVRQKLFRKVTMPFEAKNFLAGTVIVRVSALASDVGDARDTRWEGESFSWGSLGSR